MNLSGPRRDLEIAEKAIQNMKRTTNFREFRENWENFLFRIERAWEHTERTLNKRKGSQKWHQPYQEIRKKDPLLIYLRQARNSEVHSISDTVTKPLKLAITDKSGRGFLLNRVSTHFEDGIMTVDIDSPDILLDVDTQILPTNPGVLRFKNRGKWFNPPWQHLRKRINSHHPAHLASLAISFYQSYVNEAESWLNGR